MNTTRDERILERLSESTAAGVSLEIGLRAAADEAGASAISRSLRRIANQLEKGASLDVALSPELGRKHAYVTAAIRAGMETGQLGQVLVELIEHQQFQRRLRSAFWSNFTYPVVLILVLGAVLVLIVKTALPEFLNMFDDFGMELPATTLALVWATRIPWPQVMIGMVMIPCAAIVLRILLGKSNWRLFLSTMPVFGQLLHWSGVSQFARLLPIFLRQGVPLPQALELTSSGIRDANIATATGGFARRLQAGGTFQPLLEQSQRVPHTVSVIVGWGEQHDRLPESLELLAEISEGRMLRHTDWLAAVIPPLLFVLIAAAIAGVVAGMFLPLISLLDAFT